MAPSLITRIAVLACVMQQNVWGGPPECIYKSFTGDKKRLQVVMDVNDYSLDEWSVRVRSGVCHYLCKKINANDQDSFTVAPETSLALVGELTNGGDFCYYSCEILWTESIYNYEPSFFVEAYMSHQDDVCGWDRFEVRVSRPFDYTCGNAHYYTSVGCTFFVRQEGGSHAICESEKLVGCSQFYRKYEFEDGPFSFDDGFITVKELSTARKSGVFTALTTLFVASTIASWLVILSSL